jgi:hypothetical protein
MPKRTEKRELPANEAAEIERVAALLGGNQVLRHRLFHKLDVHEFLDRGLPRATLAHLYKNITFSTAEFFRACSRYEPAHISALQTHSAETAEQGAVRADLEICSNSSKSNRSIRIPGRGIGLA